MSIHPLAGKPVPDELLIDVSALLNDYYSVSPDTDNAAQLVSFGTSGHRGTSTQGTFNDAHIAAICQAIVEFRQQNNISGPLFIGKDTHALSDVAYRTAVEVFAANQVHTVVQQNDGFTPTPVISHAILVHNHGKQSGLADGVVITPSHNPPADGGFKYNSTNGGPADTSITEVIQERANQILIEDLRSVRRLPFETAVRSEYVRQTDFVGPYVEDLGNVIDMQAIAAAGVRIGADPLGGSGIGYWEPIAERYGLQIEVVNKNIDPTFRFMRVDRDGKVRMDCSSPWAMAGLIDLKDRFDIAVGNDPDFDRHGIVTPAGLMNPNHYLAVSVSYLFRHRPQWRPDLAVGKTLVSSSMIDRVAASIPRPLCEVPVGFKWFVDGLFEGKLGFGGEESAGASFLRKDGTVWTTDKDGIIMALLAAEMTAVTGRTPDKHYADLEKQFGSPVYRRIDAPATAEQRAALKSLSPDAVTSETLAGETIVARLTKAPGNNADIGGLKVITENGWFAARPSGTEDIYKIYAESFLGEEHLQQILNEAQQIVDSAIARRG